MKKIYTCVFIVFFSFAAFANNHKANNIHENTIFSGEEIAIQFSETDLSIYPNPVKNFATIQYTSNVDRIVIMNIVGKEVKTITPEADQSEIRVNLTDLQQGVYFIAAYSNNIKLITKRFMKEQ